MTGPWWEIVFACFGMGVFGLLAFGFGFCAIEDMIEQSRRSQQIADEDQRVQ